MNAMHNALQPVQKEVRSTFYNAILYRLSYLSDFPLTAFLVNSLVRSCLGIIK